MAKSRSEVVKERYNRIVEATGNVELARKYRYYSPIRTKREIGVDVTKKQNQRITSSAQWGRMASPKFKETYPEHIEAFAIQKNREVGADDFDGYGFIYAYKRIVEGKGPRTINREIVFSRAEGTFLYIGVRSV